MIKMKSQVSSLLKELFIGHLLDIQKQKNPLKSNETDNHFDNLVKHCQSTMKVFNRRKYRALIALGILKTSKPINKNDYYITVSLTKFGLIACKQIFFKFNNSNFEDALTDNPDGFLVTPLSEFWDGVHLPNNYMTSNVFFKFTSFDDFETWLLKYPNIKKIVPFINNRAKTEETIRAIYNYVYIKPMDYSSMNEDDDILFL